MSTNKREPNTDIISAFGKASRPYGRLSGRPDAIVVAASTGGPQALATLFSNLGKLISEVPVFVVLHVPEHFTSVITTQIERISGRPTHAASDGEIARAGNIYFAPGNKHLVLKKSGIPVTMHLDNGPPVNFCRPSADRLFETAAEIYGGRLIAIVLSGMGSDGCAGASLISAAGGSVLAQDKETSAVWGMPAAVVEAGLAQKILPIDCIAMHAGRLLNSEMEGAAA